MATFFKRPANITGIAVGEIRIRNIGPAPMVMAKMALIIGDEGTTGGQTIFQAFSPRTLEIIKELNASIESDVAEAIMVPLQSETRPPDEETEEGEEGINLG